MKIPKLDHHQVEEILQQAKQYYEQVSMTTLQASDPIYTMLESQALLIDMLNFAMEQVEPIHQKKLNELISFKDQEQTVVYNGSICVKEVTVLPKEQLFYIEEEVGYVPVETIHPYTLYPFDIEEVSVHLSGVSNVYHDHGQSIEIDQMRQGDGITLVLPHSLTMHQMTTLYIQTKERKPQVKGNQDLYQDEFIWEFYSIHGWQKLQVTDDTCSLRYSGELIFIIEKPMKQTNTGYLLRARCNQDLALCPRQLSYLTLNRVTARQGITLATTYEFQKQATIELPVWYDIWSLQGKKPQGIWERCPISSTMEQETCIQIAPAKEFPIYRVVCYRNELLTSVPDRSITGATTQEITLPQMDELRIAIEDTQGRIRNYPIYQHEPIESKRYGALLQQNTLIFGDGRNFLIPEKKEQGIWFLHLHALTYQESKPAMPILHNVHKEIQYRSQVYAIETASQLQHYCEQLLGSCFHKVSVETSKEGYKVLITAPYELTSTYVKRIERLVSQALSIGSSLTIEYCKEEEQDEDEMDTL